MSDPKPYPGNPVIFLESLLGAIPWFIMQCDAEDKLQYLSELQPGYKYEDVLGLSMFNFVHPDSHEVARATIQRVRDTGRPDKYPLTGAGADGATTHYETWVAPVGTEGSVCLIAMDVTDQVERSTALEKSREMLQLAIDATGIGLWSWDAASGTVEWNDRMRAITGHDEPFAIEQYVGRLVHPEDRESVAASTQAIMETGEWVGRPHRIVRPDGAIRWHLSTGSVMSDAQGQVTGMVGGNLDITPQRKLEEQLLQAQKMEAVGNLTAGIAHNFNNMLSAIIPSLELLRPDLPPDSVSLADNALLASRRAAAMVEQLMTFAGQQRATKPTQEDVAKVAERALEICRHTFDRQIELRSDCTDEDLRVVCDPGNLEQVVMNLLLNARDAVTDAEREGPQITVRCERVAEVPDGGPPSTAAGFARIRVLDNGGGVAEDAREHIFEPFFTTKDVGRGTGLGLATSYAMVRDHGGLLRLDPEFEDGACFEVYLPLAEPERPSRLAPAAQPTRSSAPGTVLVLEDEELLRDTVRRVFEPAGHTVLFGIDTSDARRALAQVEHADLVLLDLSMPLGSGETLIPEIRERFPNAKLWLFTGQTVRPGLRESVDGVLRKPVGTADLIRALESALSSKE